MKKTTIIAIVVACIIVLGSGGAYATGQIARSNAISEEEAINFACVDAGVSPENIEMKWIEFDFDYGKFVYEIEFIANGMEYDYSIDSSTGKVVEKSMEILPGYNQTSNPDNNPGGSGTGYDSSNIIGIENAKQIALSSAGLKEEDVVFSKAKLDREDGSVVYDIEFYVYGKAEYDYEINASTGEIIEEGFDPWDEEDAAEYALAQQLGPETQDSVEPGASSGSATSESSSSSSAPASSSSNSGSSGSSGSSSGNSSSSSAPAS